MISLWHIFYPGISRYILPVVSLVFIYLYGKKNRTIGLKKRTIYLWLILLFVILCKNYEIKQGIYEYLLMYIALFLTTIFLVSGVQWIDKTIHVIQFFCIVHLTLGLFFVLNKAMLINKIVPLFKTGDSAKRLLIQAIDAGYMTGITYHYSTMGMYMALGTIFFSGVLYSKEKSKAKILKVILFLLMILGLFMTGKRGPLVFSLISIAWTYMLFCLPKTEKQVERMFIGALGLIVLYVIAYMKVPQVRSLMERFTTSSGDLDELSSGRIEYFWKHAVSMFKDHPILGNGWRTFKYYIVTRFGMDNPNDAHNIYLQLLAEVGIVGFLFFITYFLSSWKATYTAIKSNEKKGYIDAKQDVFLKVSLSYQTFFILYGFTGNPLYDLQCYVPYFLCTAIGWAGFYYVKKQKDI